MTNTAVKQKKFNALGDLVVAGADEYSRSDVLHLLREARMDAFIVEEDGAIYFEGIRLVFDGERLTKIE